MRWGTISFLLNIYESLVFQLKKVAGGEEGEKMGEGFFNHWLKEKPGRISRSTMTEEATPTRRPSALMTLLWTSIFLRFPQLPNRSDPSIFSLFSRLFFPSKPWISTNSFLFSQLSATKKRKKLDFFLVVLCGVCGDCWLRWCLVYLKETGSKEKGRRGVV